MPKKNTSPQEEVPSSGPAPIVRHRTAIRRLGHSRPVSFARAHGFIGPTASFFDYGCGFGEDVELLKAEGFDADGWDPYYRPGTLPTPADCVNLGYVLNVIEDIGEREETLRDAFELARRVLIVSVRVDQSLASGVEFSDGLVTNSGSFQKIYTQSEFRGYLEAVLGRKPYMASLGIAYVFKDESLEAEHLAGLSITPPARVRLALCTQFAQDPQGREFTDLTRALGRPPLPSEFHGYSELLTRFGTRARIERLLRDLLNPESLAETQTAKKGDILTYLSMLKLCGLKPPRFRLLPAETQADIKLFWPSYTTAIAEGEQFLFQLGNPDVVRQACLAAPVGKRLPTDLYLHRSAEETLPALLRVLIFAARQVVGEVGYNIVKVSTDGRKVSFLHYKDFDDVAHPELLQSIRVHLPNASYSIRDYTASKNPPILHRKESFVDPLYPRYGTFAELTHQEDECGLLSRSDVGFRAEWLQLLKEQGMHIVGHELREGEQVSIV